MQVVGHVGDQRKPTGDKGFVRTSYRPKESKADSSINWPQIAPNTRGNLTSGPVQESQDSRGHVESSTHSGFVHKLSPPKSHTNTGKERRGNSRASTKWIFTR